MRTRYRVFRYLTPREGTETFDTPIFLAISVLFRYLTPREGTETFIIPRKLYDSRSDTLLPVRGRKPIFELHFDNGLRFRYLTPREGTETWCSPGVAYRNRTVQIPYSPRGDGNFTIKPFSIKEIVVQTPCSPRGDGNR